ncbi:D-alanyl-D-alanine carboxypeptidase/D-alanyl-D-alanine-endopeptidase [Piscinibacter sakaiensis]|uniref:D-alanyl-D-alanine carboxypeptidase/D-alanyl-D-alanine endopeptidase n=1 Tax=Piscinibacter sakaiensis TaxID=1547922 RepID=UPI003AAE2024
MLWLLLLGGTVPAAAQQRLPPEVIAALRSADIAAEDMVAIVEEAGSAGAGTELLAWQARRPVNPASLMKLWPTLAGLELLGPAWRWKTPVWLTGTLPEPGSDAGIYNGDIVIRGSGDPTLVVERLWQMWMRLRQLGIREIRGDIVLDRSGFAAGTSAADPGEFDDEPLRPYNVQPDVLLFNHKAVHIGFRPEPARGIARLSVEPPLDGVRLPVSVPLKPGGCGNWRADLQADFSDPTQLRLGGAFPTACGEKRWSLAYPAPAEFNARLLVGLWHEMGGRFSGRVRGGVAPNTPPSFELESAPLAEVVRDINKFSNNVMAQNLFLSLPLALQGSGSVEGARRVVVDWARPWLGDEVNTWLLDNGSGLSRHHRVSALALARLLQRAWSGPLMPEFFSSLPASGIDGTLRRSSIPPGRAHLKTGSLRDVAGIAGHVLADNGRRYIVVAIINHPNANAARAALDQLASWAIRTPLR